MQPKSQRRVHGAEFKAQVLAECQQPGASVAAVALSHGLNVNLVRKWLVGRGIKRTGLPAPRPVSRTRPGSVETAAASPQFIPVELAPLAPASEKATGPDAPAADIHIEVIRGGTRLSVRWPSAQAASCAAWLHELAAAALKE
ncbi:Transposase [Methylibium sp. T29]|nr:Transposase [Methylibium sp. T29]EWS59855.1 Transposase [Methylibium sp. T29-B]